MRKGKDLFTRVCAYVLVLVMVLTCSVTGSSTEAYAGTVSVQDVGATSKMVKAKKTAAVDKIVVSSKMSNVYEGQKFNEASFRKSTTVKIKKNGKVYKTTKYSVKAPVYIKANGTGKNAGKFLVKVTYGGRSAYKVMNIYRINKITVKSTGIKSLDEGVTFNKNTFKKKAVVAASYKVGKKTVVYKLPDYTVTAAVKVTANAKGKKDSFQVSIKCGKKTAVCSIPVVAFKQIQAKLTAGYSLHEGDTFDAETFKKHVAVYKTYTNNTRTTPVTGFTVAAANTVTRDGDGKFKVTVTFAGKTTTVAIPVVKAEDPTHEPTISEITVSSNIPYLYNGTEVDNTLKATIENSLTVTATMSDGSTKTLDSNLYKVRTVTRVVVYTAESDGFRVDVDCTNGVTGKCYIPVIIGIIIHPKDTSASFELTKGASYTKEDFLKLFDVFDIYGDEHEEACKEYEFIAPETVYANGEGEFAGQFVVKVTSNSGNFNYSVSYKIIDGGTVTPDPTPIGVQEVDWLYYYGNFVSVSEFAMITVRAAVNAPSDCGTLTKWGVMCLHSENIDITQNPEKAIKLLGPINNNSGSEPFLDQINDDEWASLTTAQYRIFAVVEKDGISTTYYSKVLYVEKSTENYYFSK